MTSIIRGNDDFDSDGQLKFDPTTSGLSATTTKQAIDELSLREFAQGQTWQDVTSIRSANVTYTNNTGRPIQIYVASLSESTVRNIMSVFIQNSYRLRQYSQDSGGGQMFASIIVTIPDGGTYEADFGGAGSLHTWYELR